MTDHLPTPADLQLSEEDIKLRYAWRKYLLTTNEVNTFISEVRSKGSIIPEVDIKKYECEKVL